jgi:hypothetical protein
MALAKCPSCGKNLLSMKLEPIDIRATDGRSWHGVVYSCPMCMTAISTGIDPLALKADTGKEFRKKLGRA